MKLLNKVKKLLMIETDDARAHRLSEERKLAVITLKAQRAHENNVMAHILRGEAMLEWDWLADHYPDMLSLIMLYIKRNNDYTFIEAFESVDSAIYGEWKKREILGA